MIKYPEIDPVALSIPLPEFLHSFLGTALNIHWYGLAYVLGAYLIYLRMCATREKFGINVSKDEVSDVVFTYGLFFGAIIGGRLGHVFVLRSSYSIARSTLFFKDLARRYVFSHGGLLGVMVAIWFYATKRIFFFPSNRLDCPPSSNSTISWKNCKFYQCRIVWKTH